MAIVNVPFEPHTTFWEIRYLFTLPHNLPLVHIHLTPGPLDYITYPDSNEAGPSKSNNLGVPSGSRPRTSIASLNSDLEAVPLLELPLDTQSTIDQEMSLGINRKADPTSPSPHTPDSGDEITVNSNGMAERKDRSAVLDLSNLPEGKGDAYRVKADELRGLVGEDTIPGSRSFAELTLYEKKSVLINRELE